MRSNFHARNINQPERTHTMTIVCYLQLLLSIISTLHSPESSAESSGLAVTLALLVSDADHSLSSNCPLFVQGNENSKLMALVAGTHDPSRQRANYVNRINDPSQSTNNNPQRSDVCRSAR